MIIDNLSNANTYFSLHPLFKKAFEYLNTLDLKQLEPVQLNSKMML